MSHSPDGRAQQGTEGGSLPAHSDGPAHEAGTEAGGRLSGALDRLLVASVRDYAIFAVSPTGRILTWNAGAEQLKGYSAGEAIGRHLSTFYPGNDAEQRVATLLGRAARDGRVEDEGWRVRKDGSRFWANVVITALRDATGELVGFAKVTRDLTERRAAEEQARQLAAATAAREVAERDREELLLLAERLEEQSRELEAQSEEAQALAEELEQTNEQLQEAALEAEMARAAAERGLAFLSRVQDFGAALSRALGVDAVTRTVVREIRRAIGADAAYVVRTTAEPAELELVHGEGFPMALEGARARFALEAPWPAAEVVRSGEPLWLHSQQARQERFGPDDPSPIARSFGASATLPLVAEGRTVGSLGVYFHAERPFPAEDRAFLGAIAEQVSVALERARLFEAEAEARAEATGAQRRAEFLSDASRLLSSSLDYHVTLEALAKAAVPFLGDWCAVDMVVSPAGQWPPQAQRLAVMHQDPRRIALAHELQRRMPTDWDAPTGLARVVREGVTEFLPVVPDELLVAAAKSEEQLALLRDVGFRSYLCVPLRARGAVMGALTLVTAESGRHYDEADRALAEELAHRASLAIEHASLYREAQAANAAKTQFLAVMSHELRTPLNAIGGYTDLLELGVRGPLTEEQRIDLQRIRRSQQHLLTLINEVLDFARIEAGQAQYRIEDVRVAEVLETVTTLVAPQAGAKSLVLRSEVADQAIAARADREKVHQILANLLSNAIKFTGEGGAITLRTWARGGLVEIAVSDTGIGIPADRLGHIFEPFVQVQSALTRTASGTGLGLAISRDLARGMGGDLRVESSVGVGSTFTLSLPKAGTTL